MAVLKVPSTLIGLFSSVWYHSKQLACKYISEIHFCELMTNFNWIITGVIENTYVHFLTQWSCNAVFVLYMTIAMLSIVQVYCWCTADILWCTTVGLCYITVSLISCAILYQASISSLCDRTRRSVCLSVKCIVAKWLSGSGCHLGCWVGSVEGWVY